MMKRAILRTFLRHQYCSSVGFKCGSTLTSSHVKRGALSQHAVVASSFSTASHRDKLSSELAKHSPHKDSHHRARMSPIHNVSVDQLADPQVIRLFLAKLDQNTKNTLRLELTKDDHSTTTHHIGEKVESPSKQQYFNIFIFSGIPFIAFGLLDNMIMIVAGEYIDITLGAALGISTMAAAALGNMISDVAGVGTTGYVETLVGKLGLPRPDITLEQSCLWQVKWIVGMGRVIGIAIGCLIGMFPLLFISDEDKECEESNEPEKPTTTTKENNMATTASVNQVKESKPS